MWEITLKGRPSDIIYFLELKNNLKTLLGKDVLVVIAFENDLVVSIAVVKNDKLKQVKICIYETIIKIVKTEYLSNNLKILSDDKSMNAYVVSNLISMEIVNEIKYAMQVTKLSNIVDIRSFVNFKLHNFFEVWNREIEYYNIHFGNKNGDNYIDFLKFLANSINTKEEIMYLEKKDSLLLLLDKKRKKLKHLYYTDDVGLIASLIMFAPKKLIINCTNELSKKVNNLISYIFEDRVSILL